MPLENLIRKVKCQLIGALWKTGRFIELPHFVQLDRNNVLVLEPLAASVWKKEKEKKGNHIGLMLNASRLLYVSETAPKNI